MSRKFLVPIVVDPAYLGLRSDAPTQAIFQHTADIGGGIGFSVSSDGFVQAIGGAGHGFSIYDSVGPLNAPTTYTNVGKIGTAGSSFIDGVAIGQHPAAAGQAGIWLTKDTSLAGYVIINDGSWTHVNGQSSLRLKVGNVDIAWCTSTLFQAGRPVMVQYDSADVTWGQAQFIAYPTGSTQQARIALQSSGIAPQMRSVTVNGEKVGVINSVGTAWAPIGASAFETNSTITAKRHVRSLCQRERIVVRHDPHSDLVPMPDIMSLRPVAFRPKVPALRIVPTDGHSYTADPATWRTEPEDGVLGHEGTRERLGLIAEEVETVIPSAVTHDRDGKTQAIDYAQVTVALLDHVQRLTDEVATLRYRISELEGTS
jgi:hypothetical protein